MYETGASASVRAFHRMPGLPPPEGERHAHDYRIGVLAQRGDLDERGMVVDLDRLNAALDGVVGAVAERDLDAVIGADAVTVEVFARWVHDRVGEALGTEGDGVTLRVRVFESAEEFGGYAGPLRAASTSA